MHWSAVENEYRGARHWIADIIAGWEQDHIVQLCRWAALFLAHSQQTAAKVVIPTPSPPTLLVPQAAALATHPHLHNWCSETWVCKQEDAELQGLEASSQES